MSKHIKAGWNRNIPPARKYPIIYAGRNTHVVKILSEGLTDEEIEAHANLVAAAPRLLAALNMVKQWNDVSGLDHEWPIIMDEVNAAIKAAEIGY